MAAPRKQHKGRPHSRPAQRPKVEPPTHGPVEVEITRVGGRGDGLGEWQGHRLFVPQTLPGDRLMVKFGEGRADGWEGVPVSLLAEGPGRTDPACRHFGTCGGCATQHMDEATYTAWKLDMLTGILDRAGLLGPDVVMHPMARTPAGGRRRATLVAAQRGRRTWVGFNERHSHRLVDLAECAVLAPPLVALLGPLRTVLAQILADGQQVDVALTLLEDGVDMVLEGLPEPDLRVLETLAAFAEEADLARLCWRSRPGLPAEPIAMRRRGTITFGPVTLSPAPGTFLQASPAGEGALIAAALLGIDGATDVADLFAGSGTFTFPASKQARIHAVEGDPDAVAALQAGARVAGGQVSVEKRDLFRDPLPPYDLNPFQAVIFDPPRAGAQAQVEELAKSTVPTVVAVSCNPASFARDGAILVAGGYRLTEIWPVDQFLWSSHLELVGIFRRG